MVSVISSSKQTISNSDFSEVVHFQSRRGDSFYRWIGFEVDGAPEDIQESSFKMHVRSTLNEILAEFKTPIEITVIANKIEIIVPAEKMALIPPGNWNYDLQQTDAFGLVSTRIKGNFIINQDYTY